MSVARCELTVDGCPARLWRGGHGLSLLLLHGGWGGAQLHWAAVWDALAQEREVIALDLPGVADESSWAPRGLDEAVDWIEKVLAAAEMPAGVIVGNSFGAALASRLASRSPERCAGLVLVDGGPQPRTPATVRALLRRRRVRQAATSMLRRNAWTPSALTRAFADPARAPAELRAVLTQHQPPQLATLSRIILAGDPPVEPPHVRTLVVWGAQDRLSGTGPRQGRRLARSLANAQLKIIPDAGHLPQVEQPEAFVRAVLEFSSAWTASEYGRQPN